MVNVNEGDAEHWYLVLEVLDLLWAGRVQVACRVCIPVQLRLELKVECEFGVKSSEDEFK